MDIKFNNEIYNVEASLHDKILKALVNGENKEIKAFKVNENTYHFSHNDTVFDAYAAEDNDHIYVFLNGKNYVFNKISEDDTDFAEAKGSSANSESIMPPMPGSVVKVLVEQGQKVADGDAIVVVEAMKMETTLYTGIDGVVTEINVKAGEQVGSDKVLCLIEKEEEK